MGILDLFQRGGLLMYAIAGVSVFGLAIFLERMWSLQRAKVIPRSLVARITELSRQGRVKDALLLCAESRTSIGSIYRAVLKHTLEPLPIVKEAAEEADRQEAARLERFVGGLGTVTGMISVFQRVAETGVGSPLDMAAGIWEALLTTAFGLSVGIPALLAHRFTLSRVDRLVLELEEEAIHLVELVRTAAGIPFDQEEAARDAKPRGSAAGIEKGEAARAEADG